MKLILGVLVALGLIGGVGYWYHQGTQQPGPGFRTAPVERGNLSATISATGTIEPEEVVDIGAQVAGMILRFGPDPRDSMKTVDYGTPVEEGTVLAQIDDSLYRAQVDQARANELKSEADLKNMEAKVTQADLDWQRAQRLGRDKGVISGLDYDTTQATYLTSRASLEVGKASIAQAQAALHQAEINLGYCTIKSPVKGVIVDRRVNIGQTVVSSLSAPSLFLIAKDLKRMQIWASVNEADIGQIHPGQAVAFTVDAYPNEKFKGTVGQIRLNATMTQNVVTYTVVVNTDNSDGKLLPYLTANLQFEIEQHKNVLLVPNAALRWKPQPAQIAPDARSAYTAAQRKDANDKSGGESEAPNRGTLWVEENGFVRPVKVHTGLTDGAMTEINSGDVAEKSAVVIGAHKASSEGGSGGASPFTPQMFRGKQ